MKNIFYMVLPLVILSVLVGIVSGSVLNAVITFFVPALWLLGLSLSLLFTNKD